MYVQHGMAQQSKARRRSAASQFGIGRSRLGRLSVRFDGGPSYPEIVDMLQDMVNQYGYLVRHGERLSGAEWIERISETNTQVSALQTLSIKTFMRVEYTAPKP